MTPLYRYLDATGDGTGNKNFNGNYSSAQGIAKIVPPAGVIYEIARLIITVEDTSGMHADEYGSLNTALGNGIEIGVSDPGGEIVSITDGVPIVTNAGWSALCYDVDVMAWGVTPTNEHLSARFTFLKAGQFLGLNGDAGNFLWVSFDDNLTGLISHMFMAQGFSR